MFRNALSIAVLTFALGGQAQADEILDALRTTRALSWVDNLEDGPNVDFTNALDGFWSGESEASTVFGDNSGYGLATQESLVSTEQISGTLFATTNATIDDAAQIAGTARTRLVVEFIISESADFRLIGSLTGEDSFNSQGTDSFVEFYGPNGKIIDLHSGWGIPQSFDVSGTLSPGIHNLVVDVSIFSLIHDEDGVTSDPGWSQIEFTLQIPSPGALWALGGVIAMHRQRRRKM